MKGLFSAVIALLLILSTSVLTAVPSSADDDAGSVTNALCTQRHNGAPGGTQGPDDADVEGDPETWLGGQNSVVEPEDGPTIGCALIKWLKKLVAMLPGFGV
jgi:hypothetical protein